MNEQSSSTRADGARSHQRAALVIEGLSRIARASQLRRLYGAEHQQSAAGLSSALEGIRSMIADSGSVQVGVEAGRVLLDGSEIAGNQSTEWLTQALVKADVAGLRIVRGPGPNELSAFLDALYASDREQLAHWTGADDAQAWLRLIAMSGSALRFQSDSAEIDKGATKPGDVWRELVSTLLDRSTTPNAMALESLNVLEAVAASASAQESQAVREGLARLAKANGDSPDAETPESLRAMLASLSPQARTAMLSVASSTRPEWIEKVSDKLPVHDLAAAMAMLDRCGQTPPDATLMLLSKLVGLTELSSAVRHDLQHMQARWTGLDRAAERHLSTPALTELLRSRGIDDYCPTDYREQLHRASTSQNAQVISLLGLKDFEGDFTALRSCEVAAWLLGHPSTAGVSNAGALAHVGARIGLLMDSPRADLVAAAVDAVRRDGQSADREFVETSRRLRQELASPGIVEQVLTRATRAEVGPDDFLRHLELTPIALLEQLLARAESGRHSPMHPLLRLGIAKAEGSALAEVLARACADTARRSALVPMILRLVPEERLENVCAPLLSGVDADLRAAALSAMDTALELWSEPILRAALSHADDRIVGMGLGRIMKRPDACGSETLCAFLEGSLSGVPPTGSVQLAAMQVLMRRSADGPGLLAGVLDRLNRGVSRNRIRACRAIAYELESASARPEVARSLKRWRRSLAHTVGLFILDDERRRAA